MNLLNKLTKKNLKLNRKRTVVTIIGIILSVALVTAVATMYISGIESIKEYEKIQAGNFHVVFYNMPVKEVEVLKNNQKIEAVYTTKQLGFAYLNESKNEYKPYANVLGLTKESLKNLSIRLVEGRLPENEKEILIPTHLKTNGRVFFKVGDEIELEIGKRISNEYELNQSNPYSPDDSEEIVDKLKHNYKIVGVMERPGTNIEPYSAPGYTFVTLQNNNYGNVDAYVLIKKEALKDNEKIISNILNVDEKVFHDFSNGNFNSAEYFDKLNAAMGKAKYQFNFNRYLISLELSPLNNSYIDFTAIALIVSLIIVFTSAFCIRNSFDISIQEKVRQYGMLRSIGATKKQIKKNVYYEAFLLGLIAIPIGIICGIFASYILIIVCNFLLKDMFSNGARLTLSISWLAIIFSICLGLITIYLSAHKSARKASKISPIDSIRNSKEIKMNSKKINCPKLINTLFGIGGVISYKNLKRNKKKYRTTVISIIVSVATFISLSAFVSFMTTTIKDEMQLVDYNLSLMIKPDKDEDIYSKVLETTKLDNIDFYSVIRYKILEIDSSNYSEAYSKVDPHFNKDYPVINVLAVGEKAYNSYLKALNLKYDDIKDKGILIDTVIVREQKDNNKFITKKVKLYKYNVGDKAIGKIADNDFSIEIGNVTFEKPFSLTRDNSPMIIVSDEFYEKHLNQFDSNKNMEVFFKSGNPDKLQDEIENMLKDSNITIENIAETIKTRENVVILISIFLYGFIIVISLIGITNVFNTITTNMELRKREFASLKSIGMTKKEFNRMIGLESIFMGLKSLFFGLPIGIALSILIYRTLAYDNGTATIDYVFPYKGIIISIILVIVLISLIMKYSINKIDKHNLIETIRNENI